MKHFTITRHKDKIEAAFAILFWLAVWQIASMCIGQSLLLASPAAALKALVSLAGTGAFWLSVGNSFVRIVGGFLLAAIAGVLLAALSAALRFVRVLLGPFMLTVRSVPVASFIILALLWLQNGAGLSVLISFLMVLPVVYENVLKGILHTDAKLLQAAQVYRMPFLKRLLYIYTPAVRPFFLSALASGLGLCWKSGVAAEMIGITEHSIGGGLYNAKLYFATDAVLAWTAVIVLLSFAFEKLFMALLQRGFALIDQKAACMPKLRPAAPKHNAAPPRLLAFENVTKRFGESVVLQGFSAVFEAGQVYAVMGKSGAGKTTLVHLLAGLLQQDKGRIIGREGVRVGMLFQENRLLEALPATANLRVFGCADVDYLAKGAEIGLCEADMQKPISALSGGQKRRVALMRALLCEADLLLLDEPFKGLDDATRILAAQFVQRERRARTLLCVTHDEEDAVLLHAKKQMIGAI